MARCTAQFDDGAEGGRGRSYCQAGSFRGPTFTFANVPESVNPAIDREFGRPAVLVNEYLVATALIQPDCLVPSVHLGAPPHDHHAGEDAERIHMRYELSNVVVRGPYD